MSVRFAAIVPVIDEAAIIGDVVTDLSAHGACCVLVVDGGSRDGTTEIACAAGAVVISEPRRGYGRACRTGAEYGIAGARGGHGHAALVFVDGDGSCTGEDAARLAAALSTSDLVLGARPRTMAEPGAMPWHARAGNHLVAVVVSARSGRRIHDLPPAKAIRSDVLQQLDLDADGYGWTVQLIGRALSTRDLRIREVPVAFRCRRGGRSKVSGSVSASVRAGAAMVRTAFTATRSRPVLVLMAKAPAAGHAKTRLAARLGDPATASVWTSILADTADTARIAARAVGASTFVMLPRADDVASVTSIIGPSWTPVIQQRPGLGEALREAFLEAFDGGADRALAMAGDVPLLPAEDVVMALDRLAARPSSAVLGPSHDGGYNLIGLRWPGAPRWWPRALRRRRRRRLDERLHDVFDQPLGGSDALIVTGERLAASGWQSQLLAGRSDIDTVADLAAMDARAAAVAVQAPRTARWLDRHRDLVDTRRDTDAGA